MGAHFQDVLQTYFNNWIEHDLIANKDVGLHLFVVYDLNYSGAVRSDFHDIPRDVASLLESVAIDSRSRRTMNLTNQIRGGHEELGRNTEEASVVSLFRDNGLQ